MPYSMESLKIFVREAAIYSISRFRSWLIIPSFPGEECDFRDNTCVHTSSFETELRKRVQGLIKLNTF